MLASLAVIYIGSRMRAVELLCDGEGWSDSVQSRQVTADPLRNAPLSRFTVVGITDSVCPFAPGYAPCLTPSQIFDYHFFPLRRLATATLGPHPSYFAWNLLGSRRAYRPMMFLLVGTNRRKQRRGNRSLVWGAITGEMAMETRSRR